MPINQSIPNLESLCNPNSKNSSNITHYDWLNENEALCTLLYANPLQSSYSGWVRAPCDNCISLHLRTSIPPPLHLCTSICKSAAPQYANQLHLNMQISCTSICKSILHLNSPPHLNLLLTAPRTFLHQNRAAWSPQHYY